MTKQPQHPLKFICTYDGESDYLHTTTGNRYSYRWREPRTMTPDGLTSARRIVGCVYGGQKDEFPPDDVAEQFAGYARARWTADGWQRETTPQTTLTNDGLYASTHWRDCDEIGCAPASLD
tara:strand:+ start:218 stop:580 length:363 start_codon:yes stop_codon:yes gene_type:complete